MFPNPKEHCVGAATVSSDVASSCLDARVLRNTIAFSSVDTSQTLVYNARDRQIGIPRRGSFPRHKETSVTPTLYISSSASVGVCRLASIKQAGPDTWGSLYPVIPVLTSCTSAKPPLKFFFLSTLLICNRPMVSYVRGDYDIIEQHAPFTH